MRKLRWQHSARNIQSKRLPAIVDRAVWKKVTKGQPVRWDKEVERVWQEIGGNKDEVLSIGASAGYKTKVRDMICLLYTSPSPRDATLSRMPSSA